MSTRYIIRRSLAQALMMEVPRTGSTSGIIMIMMHYFLYPIVPRRATCRGPRWRVALDCHIGQTLNSLRQAKALTENCF